VKTEWKFLGDKRPLFMGYIFLFIIAGLINLMTPLIIGTIFNSIQENISTEAELFKLIGMISLLLVIGIFFWIFHGTARVLEQKTGFMVGKAYTNNKIQRVLDLPISWHKDHHSGDTIDKINKGSNAISSFSQYMNFQIIYLIISLFGSAIILSFFDLKAALVAIIFSLIILGIITQFDKKLRKKYKEKNALENKSSAAIFDYISNIITVVTLRLKKIVRKELDHKLSAPYKPHKESALLNETKWGFASISIDIMIVSLLSYRAYTDFHTSGIIMVGTIYILYGYLSKMGDTFYQLAQIYGEVVRMGANIENVESIDEEYAKIKNSLNGNLNSDWKQIDIENLDFTYNIGEKKSHIDKVNISFKKGEKIALVGESGSGKSTLLALLRGLYNPEKGKVYVDGTSSKKGLNSLRNSITLIPQDPEIFNNTLKFNITMGISYKKEEIERAIKLAQFSKVVARLEKGLNTNVMEKGVSLSGGEKQRLALARGILAAKGSDIILMDEPTSSVDSMNEALIHDQIFRRFRRKTIISSIHRLHLLNKFDKIYFFENGKVIGSGTFNEMKKFPKFKKLLEKYKSVKD
jgi:ABC-type multidrug transport system fused ATPase/permease subunit